MSKWSHGNANFDLDLQTGRLTVSGELDVFSERGFQKATKDLAEAETPSLELDLSEVGFIGSACLGAIFLLHERGKARGKALRVKLSPRIAPICKMMGLDQLVDVEVPE